MYVFNMMIINNNNNNNIKYRNSKGGYWLCHKNKNYFYCLKNSNLLREKIVKRLFSSLF